MRVEKDRIDVWIQKGEDAARPGTRTGLELAVRYYVHALRLLGPRPARRRAALTRPPLTYRELSSRAGDYSYAWERLLDGSGLVGPDRDVSGPPGQRTKAPAPICAPWVPPTSAFPQTLISSS